MLFGRMLRKNAREAGAIVDGRKGFGFWVLLLNLSKFSFSLSLLSLPRGTIVQISSHLSQCVECKHTNVNLKKCAKMTLRSCEWWLQGCVLSLVGCCRLLWGWWVSGLLHCWGYSSKVFWPLSSWERNYQRSGFCGYDCEILGLWAWGWIIHLWIYLVSRGEEVWQIMPKFATLRLNLAYTLHKCHQKLYM